MHRSRFGIKSKEYYSKWASFSRLVMGMQNLCFDVSKWDAESVRQGRRFINPILSCYVQNAGRSGQFWHTRINRFVLLKRTDRDLASKLKNMTPNKQVSQWLWWACQIAGQCRHTRVNQFALPKCSDPDFPSDYARQFRKRVSPGVRQRSPRVLDKSSLYLNENDVFFIRNW